MDTNKMMPEQMKAEFEAAFRNTFGFGVSELTASRNDDAAAMMGAAAWAWQASRAAVVVELPDPNEVPDTGDYCAEAIDAIEAQGLKVAS